MNYLAHLFFSDPGEEALLGSLLGDFVKGNPSGRFPSAVADAIVFAGPIYNFAVCAQLKLLLDRMYALGGGGRWDALAGRSMGVVLTYADKDRSKSGVENAIGMFRDMARFVGMEIQGIVEAPCEAAGEVLRNAPALEAAEKLGRDLAERGSVSQRAHEKQ